MPEFIVTCFDDKKLKVPLKIMKKFSFEYNNYKKDKKLHIRMRIKIESLKFIIKFFSALPKDEDDIAEYGKSLFTKDLKFLSSLKTDAFENDVYIIIYFADMNLNWIFANPTIEELEKDPELSKYVLDKKLMRDLEITTYNHYEPADNDRFNCDVSTIIKICEFAHIYNKSFEQKSKTLAGYGCMWLLSKRIGKSMKLLNVALKNRNFKTSTFIIDTFNIRIKDIEKFISELGEDSDDIIDFLKDKFES